MITNSLKGQLEKMLTELEIDVTIQTVESRSGGSINEAYELRTSGDTFFLKVNNASDFPEMFEMEFQGLETLRKSRAIDVPKPLFTGEFEDQSFILMDYINSRKQSPNFWHEFGSQIALLHQVSNDYFGFEKDNYIGSLPQSNKAHDSWADFFIHERLEPLAKKSRDLGELDAESIRRFEKVFAKMNDLFPSEKPSLLHGDLWSGNYLSNDKGLPIIFDPAVYFGHREMDIAMSKLFGGFSHDFYESYKEHFPLEKGWEERVDLCNLYPLLVHVILFSGGYARNVKSILKRFA